MKLLKVGVKPVDDLISNLTHINSCKECLRMWVITQHMITSHRKKL